MTRHLPAGMPEKLEYPDCSVGDILAGSAHRYPDRPAVDDGNLRLTYAELYDHALRVAQGLRERGIRPGDVVAMHLPNSAWYTVGYYAVVLAGGVVTPINPALPPAAVRDQLRDTDASAAITHPANASRLAAATGDLELVAVVPPTTQYPAPDVPLPDKPGRATVRLEELLAADPAPRTPRSGDDLAHLSFTGGTTGRSKAVRVLHRHVVNNIVQVASWRTGSLPRLDDQGGLYLEAQEAARNPHILPLGEGATIAVAPMYHTMGLNYQHVSALTGAALVISGSFDPERYLEDIDRHGVNNLLGAPTLFHALLGVAEASGSSYPSVRAIVSGAAPNDTTTLHRLQKVFPNARVAEGYGLTESTFGVALSPFSGEPAAPVGSVGAPLFDTEVVIRELGGGPEVPQGGTGEVWVCGPQITDGYQNHPELTAEQYQDGWLRTGDIGRFDEDGWLFLVGRAKDMLIYKGYNVYPGPLEDLLHQHPAVALATVIGAPSPGVGEIPVGYVVPRPEMPASPELARELMDFIAARVAPYQRIREICFTEALPTSAAGKVLKTVLRDQHTARTAPTA
ncbi:class I adenylate-forming enzyme family protein [Streptomyces sp. NPDC058320]|uniref:class I adenylate-forming enzyme family protein n=1 Tax=unclassified Streptomyces TaxID=2593676 RepID=UPI00362ABA6C